MSRLTRRLERYGPLEPTDLAFLQNEAGDAGRYAPGDLMATQDRPIERIFFVLDGIACRYKVLPDGRRQIIAFILPGDMCDTRTFSLPHMDHSIAATSYVDAMTLTLEAVQRLGTRPALAQLFARSALVHQAIAREWIMNIGYRTSFERLGHLLCEIFERLRAVGLAPDHVCELPLTQIDLADALALSAVHVNRTLMEMRRSGLVTFQGKRLLIHDYPALQRSAGFDANYLYLLKPDPILG